MTTRSGSARWPGAWVAAATSLLRDSSRDDADIPQRRFGPLRETARNASRHRWVWILLGVLIVAALPRTWHLMSAGFRGDESVYGGQAGILSGDNHLDRYFVLTSRGNSNFLLYQELVAVVYFFFGVSDLAARLVSVAFSLGTVVVAFEIARMYYGRRVAYVAALGIALSGYAVMLGRLALLDSTLTFFFALTLLAFAKWLRDGSRLWFLCFAAAASLTIQAKVTGVLVLVIAALYLLVSRELWRLNRRDIGLGVLVFIGFMTPVLVQIASNSGQFFQFLNDSSARTTVAPWHYYLDKLGHFNGYPILLVWAIGIGVAAWVRSQGDRLLLVAAVVLGLFFQFYPLKAFNYLLPSIPVLSILGARGLCWVFAALAELRARRLNVSANGHRRSVATLAPLAAAAVISAFTIGPALDSAQSDSYFGLREAAKWLKHNTPEDAGVMTLSKGSAQYALAFYAHRDSYPFGRFRLATIFPGPKVRSPRPTPNGGPSRDWVSYWPPRLVKGREVSYLVYYTDEGDDPPEAPIVESEQQQTFRTFIENFGGELVHTVRRNHEGRAWIYRVTKLQAEPRIKFVARGGRVYVRGTGFRFNSKVRLYYHLVQRGTYKADSIGSFSGSFAFPQQVQQRYWMVALDNAGNVTSETGLRRPAGAPVPPPSSAPRPAAAPSRPWHRYGVTLKVAKEAPVGSALPVAVRVRGGAERRQPGAQVHVFLVIRTLAGAPVRWKEKATNTLGDAYFNLAALELPGYYTLSAYVQKGTRRGAARVPVKVKRR